MAEEGRTGVILNMQLKKCGHSLPAVHSADKVSKGIVL